MNDANRKILAGLLVMVFLILVFIWAQSLGEANMSRTDRIEQELASYQKTIEKCSKVNKSNEKEVKLCELQIAQISQGLQALEVELKDLNIASTVEVVATSSEDTLN